MGPVVGAGLASFGLNGNFVFEKNVRCRISSGIAVDISKSASDLKYSCGFNGVIYLLIALPLGCLLSSVWNTIMSHQLLISGSSPTLHWIAGQHNRNSFCTWIKKKMLLTGSTCCHSRVQLETRLLSAHLVLFPCTLNSYYSTVYGYSAISACKRHVVKHDHVLLHWVVINKYKCW